jgi:hypothetical protein
MTYGMSPSRELGLASTELAVLMPVLIALVLAPIQLGLWWHASQVADVAAREAVDAAQVEGATETDGVTAANRFLDAAGNLTHRHVAVARTTATVTVEVTGRAPRLIPGMDWQVTSVAVGAVERYYSPPERAGAP